MKSEHFCDDFPIGGTALFERYPDQGYRFVIQTPHQIRRAMKRNSQCVARYMRRWGSPFFRSAY